MNSPNNNHFLATPLPLEVPRDVVVDPVRLVGIEVEALGGGKEKSRYRADGGLRLVISRDKLDKLSSYISAA